MARAFKLTGGTFLTIIGLVFGYAACAGIILFAAAASSGLLNPTPTQSAESGWEITNFAADYTIQRDGTLQAVERIEVDFADLQRHGIYRDLAWRIDCTAPRITSEQRLVDCPDGRRRTYAYTVASVTRGDGSSIPYVTSTEGDAKRLKIGDPNQTVSGKQSYVITYSVRGALDAYSAHDELYWNASGAWPVNIRNFTTTVRLPANAVSDAVCFQGQLNGDINCKKAVSGPTATFTNFGTLAWGYQITILATFPKGTATVQPVTTEKKPGLDDWYQLDAIEIGGALLAIVACFAGVTALWWKAGRDRQYKTLYYLTKDPSEGAKPLFGGPAVVVEFLPPDGLKPAQMGVILDERADPMDVTATIIDLAVRGYLHIDEIEEHHWFGGKNDWVLTKLKDPDADLMPYEQSLLTDLFSVAGSPVQISDLRYKFAGKLSEVQKQLYRDAVQKEWFPESPDASRVKWLIGGAFLGVLGLFVAFGFGWLFGRSLVLTALPVAGFALIPLSRTMGRRTAKGSEALRRVLGFRLYIETAETRRQEFNEQANIFARYLPYAIVFGCVDKWAKAFAGLDDQVRESTSSWYSGTAFTSGFAVGAFSSSLAGFASGVSSTVSSTRSSGGGGGGFSGGGGGGGGGGSW